MNRAARRAEEAVPEEPLRTKFRQAVSKKEVQDGDVVATCGHVEPGGFAYTFDGFWKHEDTAIFFLACCEACAKASNYDIAKVKIVDVVSFGTGS